MLGLTATKPELKVVFDQVGTPTYALDLAAAICKIVSERLYEGRSGIWGYEDLLEIRERWLKYTAHAGRRPSRDDLDRLEWYDMNRDFDPEYYDTGFARKICDDYCG